MAPFIAPTKYSRSPKSLISEIIGRMSPLGDGHILTLNSQLLTGIIGKPSKTGVFNPSGTAAEAALEFGYSALEFRHFVETRHAASLRPVKMVWSRLCRAMPCDEHL